MPTRDERLLATLTHASTPFVGVAGPLVAYLVLRERGAWLGEQVTEALNFSLLVFVAAVVSSLLVLLVVGWFLLPLVWVVSAVGGGLGAVAASRGEGYLYPLNWRVIG